MELALNHQVTGGPKGFCHRLNALLKSADLEEVRFSVAYARWNGIGLVSEALEGFLNGGGRFESVYGAGGMVSRLQTLCTTGSYSARVFPVELIPASSKTNMLTRSTIRSFTSSAIATTLSL